MKKQDYERLLKEGKVKVRATTKISLTVSDCEVDGQNLIFFFHDCESANKEEMRDLPAAVVKLIANEIFSISRSANKAIEDIQGALDILEQLKNGGNENG
jgi:hypothetical protein